MVDLLTLTSAEQVLHLHQLHLQFADVHVPKSWCPCTLHHILHHMLDMLQVPHELAHRVIPQLEAGVTVDTRGENAHKTSSALVALLPGHSVLAFTSPSCPVTLGHLRAQRMAVTF